MLRLENFLEFKFPLLLLRILKFVYFGLRPFLVLVKGGSLELVAIEALVALLEI